MGKIGAGRTQSGGGILDRRRISRDFRMAEEPTADPDSGLLEEAGRCGFDTSRSEIWRWWVSLRDDQRRAVRRACDPRHERFSLVYEEAASGGAYRWYRMRFVRGEVLLRELKIDVTEEAEDRAALGEYLENHDGQIGTWIAPPPRTYYTCSTHVARKIRTLGCVPASFVCPLGSMKCPFKLHVAGAAAAAGFAMAHPLDG